MGQVRGNDKALGRVQRVHEARLRACDRRRARPGSFVVRRTPPNTIGELQGNLYNIRILAGRPRRTIAIEQQLHKCMYSTGNSKYTSTPASASPRARASTPPMTDCACHAIPTCGHGASLGSTSEFAFDFHARSRRGNPDTVPSADPATEGYRMRGRGRPCYVYVCNLKLAGELVPHAMITLSLLHLPPSGRRSLRNRLRTGKCGTR